MFPGIRFRILEFEVPGNCDFERRIILLINYRYSDAGYVQTYAGTRVPRIRTAGYVQTYAGTPIFS